MPNKKPDDKNVGNPVVYTPTDTKLNFGKENMHPPKTKYERDRGNFNKEAIKKNVKGHYGNSND